MVSNYRTLRPNRTLAVVRKSEVGRPSGCTSEISSPGKLAAQMTAQMKAEELVQRDCSGHLTVVPRPYMKPVGIEV